MLGTTFFWLQITWHSRTTLYPVMVFIHGGEYLTGSAEVYPGHVMAKREVVVVTMSYRLGVLGRNGVCLVILYSLWVRPSEWALKRDIKAEF